MKEQNYNFLVDDNSLFESESETRLWSANG